MIPTTGDLCSHRPMMDIRTDAARYYDLDPDVPDDLPFYRNLVPSKDARVLELGCGTGTPTSSSGS